MLMKYECGCVGLRVGKIVIKMRDCRDLGDVHFHVDNFLHQKSAVSLLADEEEELIKEVGEMLGYGYRFLKIQTALGVVKAETERPNG